MSSSWRAAVLAIAVSTALFACGKKETEDDKAASDQRVPPAVIDGLEAIPAGVDVLIAGDLVRLEKSPVVRRAVRQVLARDHELSERLSSLTRDCGLVPGKDISAFVIGMGKDPDDVVLAVSGNFVEAALASCVGKAMAQAGGALTNSEKAGRAIYEARAGDDGNTVFFALGSPKTVIAGASQEWLGKALADGPRAASDETLLKGARRDAALWAVGRVPAEVGRGLVGMAGVSSPPVSMAASLDVSAGLSVELEVEMASVEDANNAVSLAKTQLAGASLVAQKQGLGRLVNQIGVTAKGTQISLSLKLSEADVEEILARVDRTIDSSPSSQQNPGSVEGPSGPNQE